MKIRFYIIFLFLIGSVTSWSQNPDDPEIDSISVDRHTKTVILSWTVPDTSAIDGYLISRMIFGVDSVLDGVMEEIMTLPSGATTTFEDVDSKYGSSQPFVRQETYRVSSYIEKDGEKVFSSGQNASATVFLQPLDFDTCQASVWLSWKPYIGWGENPAFYEVYCKQDGGNYILLDKVKGNYNQYLHENLSPGASYDYYIRARHSAGIKTSSSNNLSMTAEMPQPPDILNIDNISALSATELELSFTINPDAPVNNYYVWRKDSLNAVWDSVYSFKAQASPLKYTDYVATTNQQYYYKVEVENTCSLNYDSTEISSNIVLNYAIDPNNPNAISLSWNPYEFWHGGVTAYNLFRTLDNQEPELLQVLDSTETSYEDDISGLTGTTGEKPANICYYVQAIEGIGNPYNVNGVSVSNTACLSNPEDFLLPNAFNPLSTIEKNKEFRPNVPFAKDYLLLIYNRWGIKLFESEDPYTGWKGRNNGGDLVPEGTYIYVLRFESAGKTIEKKGTVSVLYP